MEANFDPNLVIAGFPLVKIKSAISSVGLLDDRDDVANVKNALHCHTPQALRVLEELERQGFVVRTAKPKQWDTTQRGHQLAFYWHPPRRMEPAIERESERGVCGEQFEDVPCSILRWVEGEDMFEEANLQIGVTVSYESDRLIEIGVSQPDDYDDRESSGLIDTSVLIGIADAKKIAEGLQKAIAKAEREVVRRATKRAKQEKREAERRRAKKSLKASAKGRGSSRKSTPKAVKVSVESIAKQASAPTNSRTPLLPPRAASPESAEQSNELARQRKAEDQRRALENTLAELQASTSTSGGSVAAARRAPTKKR